MSILEMSYSSEIIARESKAAHGMGFSAKVRIPIPSKETKEKLETLGVVFGDCIDHVLINAELPTGWKIVQNGADARHRLIVNGNKKVASIFLKDSGYDYYGSISVLQ